VRYNIRVIFHVSSAVLLQPPASITQSIPCAYTLASLTACKFSNLNVVHRSFKTNVPILVYQSLSYIYAIIHTLLVIQCTIVSV